MNSEITLNFYNTIHFLKIVVGCSILGILIAGLLFGWVNTNYDIREIGAMSGAILSIIIQMIFKMSN